MGSILSQPHLLQPAHGCYYNMYFQLPAPLPPPAPPECKMYIIVVAEIVFQDLQANTKATGNTLDRILELLDISYSKQCHQRPRTRAI